MLLVEKHLIKNNHVNFAEIDKLSFLSKNLYNAALYAVRQHYFETKKFLNYNQLQKLFQNSNNSDYLALPRKVSQHVLLQVHRTFISFFEALKVFKKDPSKFQGVPKLPKYKDKSKGRNLLIYTSQAISKKFIHKNLINFSQTNIFVSSKQKSISQIRIVPQDGNYSIEVVYKVDEIKLKKNKNYAAIDLGVNNLAAVVFNNGHQPLLINGRPLKSMNQFYNKEKGRLQSILEVGKISKRIKRLNLKRKNKINDYLHKCSKYIVNQLVSKNISILVVGYNKEWKQETNIGKVNNQNFVQIPFLRFVKMLTYKAALAGIEVKVKEESYTSKCSFLDLEKIEKKEKYKGKRIKRGIYLSSDGRKINADLNGAGNIMRKAIPRVFARANANGIEAVVVKPIRVTPYKENFNGHKRP